MRMVNTAGHPYDSQGEFGLTQPVPAGASVDIPDGYCRPRVAVGVTRQPSIVEMLAPFLVPEDPEARKRWGKEDVAPPPAPPPVEKVAAKLVSEGMAPAVAELVASGNVEAPKKRGRPPKVRE